MMNFKIYPMEGRERNETKYNFYALLSGAIPFENSNPLELNKNLMYFVMILSILY